MQRISTAPGGGLGTGPLNSKLLRYGVGTAKAWKGIERPLSTYAFGPDKTPFQSAWKGIKDVGHMGANAAGYYSGDQLATSLKNNPAQFGLPPHIANPGAWSQDGSTFDNTWRPGATSDTTNIKKNTSGNRGKKKERAIDTLRNK